jgi:aspartate 1-decarboxylase
LRVTLLKSKIHRATVTATELGYEGSVTLGRELMRAAGLYEHEKVLIANVSTGGRFETYCLASGTPGLVCLNGAAARQAAVGDLVIIMAFADLDEAEAVGHAPKIVLVDGRNGIVAKPAKPVVV